MRLADGLLPQAQGGVISSTRRAHAIVPRAVQLRVLKWAKVELRRRSKITSAISKATMRRDGVVPLGQHLTALEPYPCFVFVPTDNASRSWERLWSATAS